MEQQSNGAESQYQDMQASGEEPPTVAPNRTTRSKQSKHSSHSASDTVEKIWRNPRSSKRLSEHALSDATTRTPVKERSTCDKGPGTIWWPPRR